LTEHHYNWFAPRLGKHIDMLVFGDRGYPLLLFPTSMGRYYEAKDRGLIESISWHINHGRVRVYCVDSIDSHSWYNAQATPEQRIHNHQLYEHMILEEVVPRMQQESGQHRIAVAGCSFGGYHAANFAFRKPDLVSYLISLSGLFDMRSRMDGYYSDELYYHNPMDFVPDLLHPDLKQMGIILGVAEHDVCRNQNEQFAGILQSKGIDHWLDIYPNAQHDWPVWKTVFPQYVSLIK
jgi:esterase/lipase superfamily enzyme